MGAVEGGGDLAHESVHLVLHLLVRLEAHVEIEDHLGEPGGLDFLQAVDDALGRADQHGVVSEILGFDLVQPRHHVDEVEVAGRRGLGIAGERGDHAFLVVADLARTLGGFLLRGVGEMREVAAHQATRLGAVFGAGLVIEVGDLAQAAIAHGGSEGRDDQAALESRGELDRGLGERAHIGRQRLLHRLGRDAHVVEGIVLAVVRDAAVRRPQLAHDLEAFLEDALVLCKRHAERSVFA